MYNKKKIATLLVIGMAAMFMMNGCSRRSVMDWHFIYSLWTMWKGREDHVSV